MYYVGIFSVLFVYLGVTASCRGGADYGYYDSYYNSYGGGAQETWADEAGVEDTGANGNEAEETEAGNNTEEVASVENLLKWDKNSSMNRNDYLQLLKNVELAWGGFEVPDEVKLQWKNWLETYKYNLNQQERNENISAYNKERGPGSGWPDAWQGLGGGNAGSPPEEPPPWSHVPVNVGAPLHCRERPSLGQCNETLIRWAFNPYIDKCVTFTYSGCSGNKNNFLTELTCEEQCLSPVPPPSGCDFNTQIRIEDYLIGEIRRSTRKCVGH